jgi:hypothetical protein
MSEASEQRVAEYLGELREEEPAPDDHLTRSIVRSARWQEAARTPVKAIAALTAAIGDGLALVIGGRRGES